MAGPERRKKPRLTGDVDGEARIIPPTRDMTYSLPSGRHLASARRREIYVHASRLFVEQGYDATSMSDIARAVKITKAGLYHFVESKEDLLFTIINWGMDELYEEVVDPARAVEDPRERLRLIIRNHLSNIGRVASPYGNPVTRVVDEASALGPERRRAVEDRKRGYFELIRNTLVQLRDRGELADGIDPTVAAHSIIGAIMWMARWRRPRGRLSLDEVIEQITALTLQGVLAAGVAD
ncbi:MAG: TetR family transcriptional regulator [Phenylobacterium sp.]|uniref:TetR/AcrR family transcriptional regulator n=1 Tax=Phenylobacterium sp. TaxID=1871053 RepID=UPI001A646922|nr:TetR/AcrR family transcriptional regulator [Phenylobacterium sp.]MBL8554115.1 TetR family transcriptional regulator [Phenylobacterium sp.]